MSYIRARTSTIGRNAGCVVTSVTRSPSIQISRPSRIDSRYSPPVRITSLLASSGDLRQDELECVVDVLARVCLRCRPVPVLERRQDPPVPFDRAPRLLGVVAAGNAMVEVVLAARAAELGQPRVRGRG